MRRPPIDDTGEPQGEALSMVDDNALVAPVAAAHYVRAGRLTRARARGVGVLRALRLPASFGGSVLPTTVLAVLILVAGDPGAAALQAGPTDQLFEPLAREPALAMFAFVACMVALAFGCAGVGVLDALAWGRLRDAAVARVRTSATIVRQTGGGFFGLTLMRFAMYSALLMFFSPLMRAFVNVAERSLDGARVVALDVALGVSLVLALAWVRFVMSVCCSWMAWRPRFFVGALVAGIVAPFRRPALYLRVGLRWLPAFFVEQALGAAIVLFVIAPQAVPALGESWLLTSVVVVAFSLARRVGLWLDATLVAIVGHQLGALDLARVGDEKSAMATSSQPSALDQHPFDPPVRGVYSAAVPATASVVARSIVTFERVLGHDPTRVAEATWLLPHPSLHALLDVETTVGGIPELRVVAENAATAGSVEPPAALTNNRTVPPPASLAGEGPSSFADLEAQLDRAVVRTAGGAPEVRWRPQR